MKRAIFIILSGPVLLIAACNMPADNNRKISAPGGDQLKTQAELIKETARTDIESIKKGEDLFKSKCGFCHKANSTEKTVGPGLAGILRNPYLPVSGKPATPGAIARQLKSPYRNMPSFSYLTDDEVSSLIAYLNTL